MDKTNLSKIIKSIQTAIKKRSPEILTGIGIAGMIGTTVMAVKATPKALILIEKKKQQEEVDKLSSMDTVKTTWICYIPAAVTGVMSVLCLIGASAVNSRRNTALATAYALSESALKEYKGKVVETIGEKKEQSVRDAITKDKINKNPVSQQEVVITEKGDTLCYDCISGRYFKSDIEKLKKAMNDLNRTMLVDQYVSLNDIYYAIGLGNISIGDELGWHVNNGFVDLYFSSHLADDGTPCVVINYTLAPRYDYNRLLI